MPDFIKIFFYEMIENYSNFNGRSTRSQFWFSALAYLVIWLVLFVSMLVLGVLSLIPIVGIIPMALLCAIYMGLVFASLILIIPFYALAFRRLHDINFPGWIALLPVMLLVLAYAFIFHGAELLGIYNYYSFSQFLIGIGGFLIICVFIAAIVLFIFFCLPSTSGENKYGPQDIEPHFYEGLSSLFAKFKKMKKSKNTDITNIQ